MRVILNVTTNEINQEFIALIKILLNNNAEIIIKKEGFALEEYDQDISLTQVLQECSNAGYSAGFLADLEQGLKTSSIYAHEHQTSEA